jgi:DNA-binding GntR family transcriptional regulator
VVLGALAEPLRNQHSGTDGWKAAQPDCNHATYAPGRKQGTPANHRSVPIRERTHARLKSLILSDRFAPGQRLTEEGLAKEFGTSRTPIREALHKLESEGLITSLPTRGFVASQDSPQEMDELIELRAILEGYALRIICGRLTEPQFQTLEEFVRMSEDALRCPRLDDLSRWNIRFHDTLHALISDKRRLHHQLVTLRQYAFRYCESRQAGPDGNRRTVEEHRRILAALRFRDPDLCEYAMREHIQRSRGDRLQPEQEPFHQRAGTDRRDRKVDTRETR